MSIAEMSRAIFDYVSNLLTAPNDLKWLQRDFDRFVTTWGGRTAELPLLADLPGAAFRRLEAETPHPVFNPSLVALDDGTFLGTVRCSNFVKFAENTHIRDGEICDVRNRFFRLTPDLDYEFAGELDDSAVRHPGSPAENGIEDCRLFRHRGEIWGIGNAVTQHGRGLRGRPLLFRLVDGAVRDPRFGPSTPGVVEKNWTPVETDDSLTLFHRLSPSQQAVVHADRLERPAGAPLPDQSWLLRGGTPLVRFGGHFLAVAHLAPAMIWGRLHYPHCFVVFDDRLRHVETSDPFFFRRRGIEFACGLQIHGGDLIVTYGVADRAAEAMRLPIAALDRWFVAGRY